MFQIFLGAMDKESVRVVGGNKKGIIDASTLVYKYVFAAGAAADDFLSRGDLMRMATAWEAVVKHFHKFPTRTPLVPRRTPSTGAAATTPATGEGPG